MLAFLCFNVYFTALYEKCDTTGQLKDIGLPMVNVLLMLSKWWIVLSRENGVLCPVARSWLLFLHDESEWKNFESNIAWGVDESHQTF